MDYADMDAWQQLAGVLTARVPTPTLNCGLVECEPGWQWDFDIDDFDLWLVVAGNGAAHIGDATYPLTSGTMLFLPPGSVGHVRQQPDHRFTVVYCHFRLLDPARSACVTWMSICCPTKGCN